jgi:DNA-directed RNA polymerase specialized sigma subunit
VGPNGEAVTGKTWVKGYTRTVSTEKVERAQESSDIANLKRSEKDKALYDIYKKDPSPENLSVLMRQFEGMARVAVNKYSRSEAIPPAALKLRAYAQIKQAIDTYDPDKGAALTTHVGNYLRRVNAVALEYANLGYVPPNRASKEFGPFLEANNKLKEKLGRIPSTQELADELGWSAKQVARIRRENRNDLISSKFDTPDTMPEYRVQRSRELEAMHLVYTSPETSNEERIVMEHLFGMNGGEKLSKGEIADRFFNGSKPKVSRLIKKLDGRFTELGV